MLLAAGWSGASRASDAHAAPAAPAAKVEKADAPAAPAKPAAKPGAKDEPVAEAAKADAHAKPVTKPAAKGAATDAQDPMDTLREKLAAKLGATKAPEAKSPYVVRVVSKAESSHGSGHATATSARSAEQTAKLVASLRAEKAADLHGGGTAEHAKHWSYSGDGGPETWGNLKPEFAKCSTGSRQSPIDIRGGVTVNLDPVQFDYRGSGFNVVDNGHTVQVNIGGGNSIEVMGRRYELVQFHFHRPSEERINGRQFDMVAHLVHKDPEGRLAVVAVMLDRGSAHPLVQTVWNNLPLEKGDEVSARSTMDLNDLLPSDRRYYTYMGSLTTPPCSEGVLWMVMQQPVTISNEQIAVFSRLYPMNARPIQSAAGRLIKQSN
ncbi:MAG: carbonic anhydrase family protein [Ideonella sp.]|nr:carbonic anhydrase family protein [Ideonella sp.]MBL0149746.1 carbonic anhydrase family protein [Ideonella sp.]